MQHETEEKEISLKDYFIPLTTTKVIHYILILGIIVFGNALFNGFLADDNGQILDNQMVHSFTNFLQFFSSGSFASANSAGIYYKPVFSAVLSVIYSFFGPVPFYFHSFQLLLHCTNAILIFLLFSKFLNRQIAFFLSLIFLVHPINVEAVVYISDLQDPLYFFWGIIGLLLLMKEKVSYRLLIITQFLFMLSLLSKETGILFLIISFLYVVFYKRHLAAAFAISATCLLAVYSYLRFIVAGIFFNKDILNPIMDATLAERLISMPSILSYYITTFFFPKILLFNQQWVVTNPDFQSFVLPLIIVILFFTILGLTVWLLFHFKRQQRKYIFLMLTWFFIGIFLHMQIFPLDATVADRWFYFPMVGLLGILGLAFQTLYPRISFPKKQIILVVIAVVVISSLAIRTVIRNANWHSPKSLYTHDLSIMRPNFSLENALAYEYAKEGNMNDALIHAERSVQIYPTFVNLTNLGALYAQKGDIGRAKGLYEQSIGSSKNYYLAYENLLLLHIKHSDEAEAKKFAQKATETFPNSKKLWLYRIIAEYKYGDQQGALAAAEQYHTLSTSEESYAILHRLQNKQPLNISIK